MKKSVLKTKNFLNLLLLIAVSIISLNSFAQSNTVGEIPELVFHNPRLIAGKAGKQGAVYLFRNVAPGINGQILLKTFSSPLIVVSNIDNASYGFDEAFQPEFGMNPVKRNQNWYIDFQLTFWDAVTNEQISIDKFTVTALDVDGDNSNVQEYVTMDKATSVTYSNLSYLGNGGTPAILPTCSKCNKQSAAIPCVVCGGDGIDSKGNGKKKCTTCNGVGLVYALCGHPFEGQDITTKGPVDNFNNIDTAATSVMATYVYNNKDVINFRIGATSGRRDGGAGVRLNSLWFKGFNLASNDIILPVKINSFNALLDRTGVNLDWSASEEMFSHYVLQRSTDGVNYSDVAIVLASDDHSTKGNYNFKDANASSVTGTLFYRLQMVDRSSEITYSDVRVVRLAKEEQGLSISTYPNPAVDQVRVTLPAAWQGKAVSIELYSGNGVRVQSLQLNNASQTETLQTSKIARGFYLVKASCGNQEAQQRIVKN